MPVMMNSTWPIMVTVLCFINDWHCDACNDERTWGVILRISVGGDFLCEDLYAWKSGVMGRNDGAFGLVFSRDLLLSWLP